MTGSTETVLNRLGGRALLAWHRRHGVDLRAELYLGLYRDRLVRGLSKPLLIYLDTNFWVRLRDAARGTGLPGYEELLQRLRAMVRAREAICVSQIYSLLEVGKQEEQSLRTTAELLDELTEGVAIASTDDLLKWECAQFIGAILQRDVTQGLCPWTKVGRSRLRSADPTYRASRPLANSAAKNASLQALKVTVFKVDMRRAALAALR
jgi:hypothetical protein